MALADFHNRVESGPVDIFGFSTEFDADQCVEEMANNRQLGCAVTTHELGALGSASRLKGWSLSSQSSMMRTRRQAALNSRFRGVTVLELLVVISSIALLASILFPAVHAARESTRNLQCTNNLRQVGLALHKYHDAHQSLPAGWKCDPGRRTAYGWASRILNELEEPSVAAQVDLARPLDENPDSLRAATPSVYVCPSDIGDPSFPLYAEIGRHDEHAQESTEVLVKLPRASYLGVFGTIDPDDVDGTTGDGAFVERHRRQFKEMTRGLGNIVAVGERTTRKLPSTWLGTMIAGEDAASRVVGFAHQGPNLYDADECEFDSRHAEHVNFLWADGHVSGVQDDIDQELYQVQARYR